MSPPCQVPRRAILLHSRRPPPRLPVEAPSAAAAPVSPSPAPLLRLAAGGAVSQRPASPSEDSAKSRSPTPALTAPLVLCLHMDRVASPARVGCGLSKASRPEVLSASFLFCAAQFIDAAR
ncbi:hypothetical protein VPH35_124001 [Triticum aestivum]